MPPEQLIQPMARGKLVGRPSLAASDNAEPTPAATVTCKQEVGDAVPQNPLNIEDEFV